MSIPATAHFCWIGPEISWAYSFAVLSCARQGGLEQVVLHHTDALTGTPALAALRAQPGVRLEKVAPLDLLREAEGRLGVGQALSALYPRLPTPVMKADLLRLAILYTQGGIYLDLDTITVAPLTPLLNERQFIGTEPIIWPARVRHSRNPLTLARAVLLDAARTLCRKLPNGHVLFRPLERFCFQGVNNAALGAVAHAPMLATALTAIAGMSVNAATTPYALGPDLFQALLESGQLLGVKLHAPHVFYPLPPEISAHWFGAVRNAPARLPLYPDTRIVHWYASVRTKSLIPLISPAYVQAHKGGQLFSALVSRVLPGGF
jgi:hypothetical protein